nr:immunoglobulin heavy chain junction region [Mus musculus]
CARGVTTAVSPYW